MSEAILTCPKCGSEDVNYFVDFNAYVCFNCRNMFALMAKPQDTAAESDQTVGGFGESAGSFGAASADEAAEGTFGESTATEVAASSSVNAESNIAESDEAESLTSDDDKAKNAYASDAAAESDIIESSFGEESEAVELEPLGDTAKNPLRIFLSYGHPEEEVVRRIKDRLEARGHEVWFDKSGLEEREDNEAHKNGIEMGDDWRESIAKGVESSNGVIAFLSKHALRPNGVCLQELDIAIAVRGGNIKTVLLDPENEAQPPAAVCHVQWLDMSIWRDKLAEGEEAFNPWFEERMRELIRVVESKENVQFSGDIKTISERLKLATDTSKQANLLSKPFYGRKWLMEQVAEWLDDRSTPRVCLITGDAGVGKSAFAANLAHWRWRLCGRVAASFFCDAHHEHYSDPSAIIQTLAYLLACRMPQYRTILRAMLDRKPNLSAMNDDDLFTFLIGEPFTHAIDGGHECMLVIIDGIDEAGDAENNRLAQVIARYATRLPEWMKVLVTSRRVSAATSPFGTGVYRLDISGASGENMEDVKDYLTSRLVKDYGSEPNFNEIVDAVAKASGGVFLYATLMVDAVLKSHARLSDLATSCPSGLPEMFLQWFEWTFPDITEYRASYQDALGCIAAAPGNLLPTDEFPVLFDWDENDVNDFLRRIEVFIRRDSDMLGNPSVTFGHALIAQWLASEEAGNYQSVPKAALKLMARRWFAVAKNNPRSLTDYEAVNVFDTLESAGLSAEFNELWQAEKPGLSAIDVASKINRKGMSARALDIVKGMKARADKNDTPAGLRASILNAYGALLRNTGQRNEAEKAELEALEIRRKLADENGTEDALSDVSQTLNNLGILYRDLKRYDEAESVQTEALSIREKLAESKPDTYLPDAAQTYGGLGILYKNTGRYAESEAAYDKSLGIYRTLAEKDRAKYISQIANVNILRGYLFKDTGRKDEAEAAYREAIDIRRGLAEDDPAKRKDVASTLWDLGLLVSGQGRKDEAAGHYGEACDIYREFAEQDPDTYLPKVATMLSNAGSCLEEIKQADKAEASFLEALSIRRGIAQDNPAKRADVASSLWDLGYLYAVIMGDKEKAPGCYVEAIGIYREFAEKDPATYLPKVGSLLTNNGCCLRDAGRTEEAETAFLESLEIRRKLAEDGSATSLTNVVQTLNGYAALLKNTGQQVKVLECYNEVLDTRRKLAESDPAKRADVASSLWDIGYFFQITTGDKEQAIGYYREAIDIYRELAETDPATYLPKVATLLNNIGNCYRDTGHAEEAEASYSEALSLRRGFVEEGKAGELPNVVQTLNNYAALLKDTGKPEEAEAFYLEALEIRRKLAEDDPARRADVASSLWDYAYLLETADLDKERGAELYLESAVIYREFAETDPATYLPKVASLFNNRAVALKAIGRNDEAAEAYLEAIDVRRILAEADRATNLPDLAEILGYYAAFLKNTGKRAEAVDVYSEKLELQRELAASDSVKRAGVADTLWDLGYALANAGHKDEAVERYREAIELFRELARDNPKTYVPDIATLNNNIGKLLTDTDRAEEAEEAFREALDLRCKLAKSDSAKYLPSVVLTLNSYANLFEKTGRYTEAEQNYLEALSVRREIAESNPAKRADVASSLWDLGYLYQVKMKDKDGAAAYYAEAIDIYRELAKDDPDTYLPKVATLRNNIGNAFRDTGHAEEAEAAYLEALELRRGFVEANRDANLSDLAQTLNNYAILLKGAGRAEEAEAAYLETIDIRREIAESNPAKRADVASAIWTLASFLHDNNVDKERSVGYFTEAADIYRELAKDDPATYLPKVATLLKNRGIALNGCGRTDEAEEAYREALLVWIDVAEADPTRLSDVEAMLNTLVSFYSANNKADLLEGTYGFLLDVQRKMAESDPAKRASVASTLWNLGFHVHSVGRDEEAAEHYKEAAGIYSELAKDAPETYLPSVGTLYNNIGKSYKSTERWDEAESAFREALVIRRDLAASDPAKRRELAGTLWDLGYIVHRLGRDDEAIEHYQEALAIHSELAKDNPDEHLKYVASLYSDIADTYKNNSRWEEAAQTYPEALAIQRKLIETDPSKQKDVASTLWNLGYVTAKSKRYEEAVGYYNEAVGYYRTFAEENPQTYARSLSYLLDKRAYALREIGRYDEAEADYREELGIDRKLVEADPVNRADMASTLWDLAFTIAKAGKREEAIGYYDEALELYRELAETEPEKRTKLASILRGMAYNEYCLGTKFEAANHYREAATIYGELAKEDPDTYLPKEATAYIDVAKTYKSDGQPDAAIEAYLAALEVKRSYAGDDPERLEDLIATLATCGKYFRDIKRYEEAEKALEEVVSIREKLAESDPAKRADVASALYDLGSLYQQEGDRTLLAESMYLLASKNYLALAEDDPETYLPKAISMLDNVVNVLNDGGYVEEGIDARQKRVELSRRLVEIDPGKNLGKLASNLWNLAFKLYEAERYEESELAYRESLGIYRSLAETNPDGYLRTLASGTKNYGLTLGKLGKTFLKERMKGLSNELKGANPNVQSILNRIDCTLVEVMAADYGDGIEGGFNGYDHVYRYLDPESRLVVITTERDEAEAAVGDGFETIWACFENGCLNHLATATEMEEELKLRLGSRISEGVSAEALLELDELSKRGDQAAITAWLEKNHPNYLDLTEQAVKEINAAMIINEASYYRAK